MRNNQTNTRIYRKYIAMLATTYRTRSDVRMFIEFLLTAAAVFVFVLFAIRPTLVTIGGLINEIRVKRETIQTLDRKIENIIAAQELFSNESERLALLDTAVPLTPDLPSYVAQVEALAARNDVEIFAFTTNTVPLFIDETQAGAQEITLSVTLSGNYANLSRTLADLENLRRPLRQSSATFLVDESGEGSELLLTVSGNIPYYVKQLPPPTQ